MSIGQTSTGVTLDSGAAMPVDVRGSAKTLRPGVPLEIPTRRPDLAPSSNPLQCAPATATSTDSGAIPLAAVDGSPATDWQPAALPAKLTVPVHSARGSSTRRCCGDASGRRRLRRTYRRRPDR